MDYLTIEEVAQKMNVSIRTVSKYINRSFHPLPFVKVSARFKRIREDDLDKWMIEEGMVEEKPKIKEVQPLEVYHGKV